MIFNNLPEFYKDPDTVYHYTTTETALAHILSWGQLKFAKRGGSNDPLESKNRMLSVSNVETKPLSKSEDDRNRQLANYVKLNIKIFWQNHKHICFCKNDPVTNKYTFQIDNYGFIKPRMWDQYGDSYKGVCLAFSKNELLKELNKNQYSDDVRYLTYKDLDLNDHSVHIPEIHELGIENCKNKYIEVQKKYSLQKHTDYKHENEFRICSIFNPENEYLNILPSLKGVIMADTHFNQIIATSADFQVNIKNKFKNKVNLQMLNFNGSGVSINDYEEMKRLREEVFKKYL